MSRELVQSEKARRLFQEMKRRGYSDVAAAAIVGNGVQESSLNTNARNVGDGRDGSDSVGVFQWNGDRSKGFYDFAKRNNLDVSQIETHGAYLDHELNTTEKTWGNKLRAATSLNEANDAMISFERPQGWKADRPSGGHGYQNRLNYGTMAYNNFSGQPVVEMAQVQNSGYRDPMVSAPNSQPTPKASSPTPGILADKPGILSDVGKKIGLTGDGTKDDPKKIWGMELDGDDGLLSALTDISKVLGGGSAGPTPQLLQMQRGQATQGLVKLSPGTLKSTPEELAMKRKRKTGLFGGYDFG